MSKNSDLKFGQKIYSDELVLTINNLSVEFNNDKKWNRVVDDVSLKVKKGQIVVLVGESGSGKSVTATSVMNLLNSNGRIASGDIIVNGKNVRNLNKKELKDFRGKEVGMIFQNATESLNPLLTIGTLVSESILVHKKISKKEALKEAEKLLERVHLKNTSELLKKYPYELSGGMCQRVMIAIAMSMNPSLLIADEPTTALDVTVQAEILSEICNMRDNYGTGILFITHDLGIVAEIADYVYVMKNGKIVESNDVFKIFKVPKNKYTKELISAII